MIRGTLIAIEGSDGSGKATQTRLLYERLVREGIPASHVSFPAYDTNFFGNFIGEMLAGKHGDFVSLDPHLTAMLFAFDRHESIPRIAQDLADGKVVVADRFSGASAIHQGGKIENEEERAVFLTWLHKLECEVLRIPEPDATFYLRVPLETTLALLAKERKGENQNLPTGARDVAENNHAYLKQSVETADWIASRSPSWTSIDCAPEGILRSKESIHEELYTAVGQYLQAI